ncbi:sialoadhesin-like isoform X1 [Labeo rohita]|nr:sialoadhesin-like isoform X1 [Labeo rohita]
MNGGVKHLSSAAVNLTVTVLEVRMNPVSTDLTDDTVELTCDTSCTLTSGVRYYWMKNGRHFRNTVSPNTFVSISTDAGSFSCSHKYLKHLSSSLCVSQSVCWDVTYTSRRVCALVNSTVDISCTYSHPSGHTVNKTFWHYGPSWDLKDLREEHQFAGRVEYVGNKLRIKDLKINTQVTRSPDAVSGGEKIILSCLTKCTLNDKHTYMWYKNGQQVTDGFTKVNKLYLDSVSNEELQQYSCAVEDQEGSTALRNTAVILCVVLTLALIGILWYRRRRCTLSKTHKNEKEEEVVQNDSVHNNTATSDYTQKADADNQDIHYSSISFKTKRTSPVPTDEYQTETTETETVYYATVRSK